MTVSKDSRQPLTPTSVLQRAKQHNEEAWQRLTTLYTPLIYAWCRRWHLNACDAENVGQEVFLALAKKLDSFEHRGQGSFRAWLRKITYNKVRDFLRKNAAQPIGDCDSKDQGLLAELPDSEPECDAQLLADEVRILYDRAKGIIESEFSHRDWQAFRQNVEEGVPATVIAKELNTTVYVIYNAKARILKRLRQEFEDVIEK